MYQHGRVSTHLAFRQPLSPRLSHGKRSTDDKQTCMYLTILVLYCKLLFRFLDNHGRRETDESFFLSFS